MQQSGTLFKASVICLALISARGALAAAPTGASAPAPAYSYSSGIVPIDQRMTYSYDRNGNRQSELDTVIAQNSPGPTILAPPVGIGTSSPSYTLDVIGNGHLNGNSFLLNATPADLFSAPYGLAEGQIVTVSGGGGSNTAYGLRQFLWDNGNGQVQYGWHRKVGGSWSTTPIMTFDLVNGGNVGIGTTSPSAPLTIATGSVTAGNQIYNALLVEPAGGTGGYGNNGASIFLSSETNAGVNPVAGIWSSLTDGGNGGTNYAGALVLGTKNEGTSTPTERMRIDGFGNIGIGTTSPTYLLQVAGTIYATGGAGALSDIRHKDKIKPLADHALDTVAKLRPVSFVWKEPKDDGMKGEQMGFIAQEVEQVLPSVVLTEKNEERTKGLKYNELIAVLTKAVQELKTANDRQEQELQALKTELAAVKALH